MTKYFQALVLLLIFLPDDTQNRSDDDQELWEAAKRKLAQRTREYIRQNPISDELRSFIDELRNPKREKRQDHNNMYAIKDAEIVPLAELEDQLNTESNMGRNFTVVPLIIPIPLENKVTLREQNFQDDLSTTNVAPSERAIAGRGSALLAVKAHHDRKNKEESRAEEAQTEETVVDSLMEEKLKSTGAPTELNKVLEDVQNLISAQKKGIGSNKEGALCNVSGYWDSESGGVTFHIKKSESGAGISMRPAEPPNEDGFITATKWNVTARIPFAQSAQVIITLTANKGRRVALFLGECRVCDGSETITGDWLVGRTSSDCKDQKASHSFVSDIFRKNNVETLREAHLKKIASTTIVATTEM